MTADTACESRHQLVTSNAPQRSCSYSGFSLSRSCDKGFGGAHCVPLVALPSVLKEDFNENLKSDIWPEVYGAERGTLSGEPLKSGTALIFKGVSIDMSDM